MGEWTKRNHTKSAIDRAGAVLVKWWNGPSDIQPDSPEIESYEVLMNWCASHGFPLNTFQMGLRQRARRIDKGVIVAQRLKRFSSVMNKLAREKDMKLSQMHDLGGCRAIVSNIGAVHRLYDLYHDTSISLFQASSFKYYDYIRFPKPDGYRGMHVVGRYSAKRETPWDGQRIEIQIRSRLQHAFATAVETATTFTRSPLKFGSGPTDWRRFFSLMGSALALREKSELVPGTPKQKSELIKELKEAERVLKVRQRLTVWANALQQVPRHNIKKFKWLLLVLNVSENTIQVSGFSDRSEAEKTVTEIGAEKRPEVDAVLVWVDSIRKLKAAYPNYYADTREFVEALNFALKS